MDKLKKFAPVIVVVLVLIVIAAGSGSGSSGSSTTEASTEAATTEAVTEEASTPTAKLDTMMDDVKVASYTVDETGVTLELSYDSADTDYITAEVTSFEYGDKQVQMTYDSDQDKYAAAGVTFETDGDANDFGSVQLQGGSTVTVKFSVDGFSKAKDYDGFAIYFDLKYSGSFSGEIKDDYVKVSIS